MKLILTSLALLTVGCIEHPSPASDCELTCGHWARLGCEEAAPSPIEGIECPERCEDLEFYEPLPHACFQAAASCEASRGCEQ